METSKTAITLPGQGAHCPTMLTAFQSMPEFKSFYGIACDALGFSPLKMADENPSVINENKTSSMLTVVASCLAYRRFVDAGNQADFAIGYSVGQLTALHLSGCIDFDELTAVVARRASLMDECFKSSPGSMLAVIGLAEDIVQDVCRQVQAGGKEIWLSNNNCVGQYSLAGSSSAIAEAMQMLSVFNPNRLVELPVSGAWHCPLLRGAGDAFYQFLSDRKWNAPEIPVIDNVTGRFFSGDVQEIKGQLVKHLTHPVLWQEGIKTLLAEGCLRFVEIGYGNVLSKFGFFISRNAKFETFSGSQTAPANS